MTIHPPPDAWPPALPLSGPTGRNAMISEFGCA